MPPCTSALTRKRECHARFSGHGPFSITPIGHIISDYPDKFGVPRQPGLAPAAHARLVLAHPFDDPLTVRGLEDFSHLWLSFIFHQSPERWSPWYARLGWGNRKVGVFASRSTHRPNRLGLSLVALSGIETGPGVTLHLAGCDLVSGTPVVDIKPYLPGQRPFPAPRRGLPLNRRRRWPWCSRQRLTACYPYARMARRCGR